MIIHWGYASLIAVAAVAGCRGDEAPPVLLHASDHDVEPQIVDALGGSSETAEDGNPRTRTLAAEIFLAGFASPCSPRIGPVSKPTHWQAWANAGRLDYFIASQDGGGEFLLCGGSHWGLAPFGMLIGTRICTGGGQCAVVGNHINDHCTNCGYPAPVPMPTILRRINLAGLKTKVADSTLTSLVKKDRPEYCDTLAIGPGATVSAVCSSHNGTSAVQDWRIVRFLDSSHAQEQPWPKSLPSPHLLGWDSHRGVTSTLLVRHGDAGRLLRYDPSNAAAIEFLTPDPPLISKPIAAEVFDTDEDGLWLRQRSQDGGDYASYLGPSGWSTWSLPALPLFSTVVPDSAETGVTLSISQFGRIVVALADKDSLGNGWGARWCAVDLLSGASWCRDQPNWRIWVEMHSPAGFLVHTAGRWAASDDLVQTDNFGNITAELSGKCATLRMADCADPNPCTSDLCDAAHGGCFHEPLPDGVECAEGKVCKAGSCL